MRLWQKKTKTQSRSVLPTEPVKYPSGIAVKTEKSAYMLHKDGKRYRIQSKQILDSWNFPLIVDTTESALANYPVAVRKLGFRDGSLLNNVADGKIYLVSESRLRHVVGVDTFDKLGVTPQDATLVSQSDIDIMQMGADVY